MIAPRPRIRTFWPEAAPKMMKNEPKSKPAKAKEASPTMSGSSPTGSGNLEEKPRLSEHEKKANHIASGVLLFHYCVDSGVGFSEWFMKWTDKIREAQGIERG